MVQFQTFEEFKKEAERIIYEASQVGVPLRLMGGAAIRIHCPKYDGLYSKLGRTPGHDLDFVSSRKYAKGVRELFKKLGYSPLLSTSFMLNPQSKYRQIYLDEKGQQAADVFLDEFRMNQVINFSNRLEADECTISLADLMLQKLQIVEINEKDKKDMTILLREHDVGDTNKETVNSKYIAKVLSDEWGFYYTAIKNLNETKGLASSYGKDGLLGEEDQSIVNSRIDLLIQKIEDEPKSMRWKMRARIGTKMKYYESVEEVARDHLADITS